jgi:hypothetical protein
MMGFAALYPSYRDAPFDSRETGVSQLRLDGRRDGGNKSGKPNEPAVRFAVQQALIWQPLLTGNGNWIGLSVLVRLACKLGARHG